MAYSRSRFLADLTLGFADGLTVPFALTAGVSSLGKTEIVVYAGLAEVCAGCLSMGVGGYLASRGEVLDVKDKLAQYAELAQEDASSRSTDADSAVEDLEKGLLSDDEGDNISGLGKAANDNATSEISRGALQEYLAPLKLPGPIQDAVEAHVLGRPFTLSALALPGIDEVDQYPWSPVLTGLSIALGYILGGLLPLIPYIFVQHVGQGLLWSTVLCVIALFLFGFGKRLLSTGLRRDRIGRSLWEGIQMAGLGGLAAGAAVVCVKLLER